MSLISSVFRGGSSEGYSSPKSQAPNKNDDGGQKANANKEQKNDKAVAKQESSNAASAPQAADKARATSAVQSARATAAAEPAAKDASGSVTDESFARIAAERQQQATQARMLIDQISGVSKASQGENSYKASLMSGAEEEASTRGAATEPKKAA